jgi:predicted RNA-binding protein with PIN domain
MFHYLLDGYNILFALPQMPPGTWQEKRLALLLWLIKTRPQGNNFVTAVFDSRQGLGDQGRYQDIDVVFTAGETADDWISRRVRRGPNPKLFVVVSDDQGIRKQIGGTGARWMSSQEFVARAKEPSAPKPQTPLKLPSDNYDKDVITDEFRKRWLQD